MQALQAFKVGGTCAAHGARDIYATGVMFLAMVSTRPLPELPALQPPEGVDPRNMVDTFLQVCTRYHSFDEELLRLTGAESCIHDGALGLAFLRLLRDCLHWEPEQRPSAADLEARVAALLADSI